VYWYGAYNNLDEAYQLLPNSKLIPLDKGRRDAEKQYAKAQKKSKKSSFDQLLIYGMQEMEEDLAKEKGSRRGFLPTEFLEVYETEIIHREEPVGEDEFLSKPKKKKNKNKVNTKRKRSDLYLEDFTAVEDVGEKKMKKDKKKAGMGKKNSKEGKSTEELGPKKKTKTLEDYQGKDAKIASTEQIAEPSHEGGGPRRLSAYEEYMLAMEEEDAFRGGTDDDELGADDIPSDDDVVDERYLDDGTSMQKKSKKNKGGDTTKKNLPKKRGTKAKVKAEKRPKGEKKTNTMDARRRNEQRLFEECEQKYLPTIRRWEKSIDNKDADQVSRIYVQLLKDVECFSAPFMEEYNLNGLMKKSKLIVNNDKRKEILAMLSKVYKSKKPMVPIGFKAEKQAPASSTEQSSKAESKPNEPPRSTSEFNLDVVAIKRGDKNITEVTEKTLSKAGSQNQNLDSNAEGYQQTSSHKLSVASTKMEKKKTFSLGKLMRPGSDTRLADKGEDKPASSTGRLESSETSQQPKPKEVPVWLTQCSSKETSLDDNRSLALEFLQQAMIHVQERKHKIIHNVIARNLESEIYEWTRRTIASNGNSSTSRGNGNYNWTPADDDRWMDKYWSKVHDLAASISGKHREGTLAVMIAEGKFESPSDLVCIPDDDLWKSFMGGPLLA
jgi:hypothetical protein